MRNEIGKSHSLIVFYVELIKAIPLCPHGGRIYSATSGDRRPPGRELVVAVSVGKAVRKRSERILLSVSVQRCGSGVWLTQRKAVDGDSRTGDLAPSAEGLRGLLLEIRVVMAVIGFQLLHCHAKPAGRFPQIDASLH